MSNEELNPNLATAHPIVISVSDRASAFAHFAENHGVGERLRLPVRRIVPGLGLFFPLAPSLDALAHFSRLGGAALSSFKVGDELLVEIISIDLESQRIQLSLAEPPPVPSIAPDHAAVRYGAVVRNVVPYGVFCRTDDGSDGLLHVSNIANLHGRPPAVFFAVGMRISVTIDSYDDKGRVCFAYDGELSSPPLGCGAPHRDPVVSANAAREWRDANPEKSRDAFRWLLSEVERGPLYASCLGGLKELGIPKPVLAWVRLFPEFTVLPTSAEHFNPGIVALVERRDDPEYLAKKHSTSLFHMPSDMSVPAPTAPRTEAAAPAKPIPGNERRILVDGSNVARCFPTQGGLGLECLLGALRDNGYEPHLFFDASAPYWFKDAEDAIGLELVERVKRDPDFGTMVPGGSQADGYILLLADRLGCHVISNDRYKDDQYAEYTWAHGRLEDGRRVHAVTISLGMLLVPDLKIAVPVANG